MQVGFSILIFLAIGVIVMGLFCLITRYFNQKLKKAMDEENQVYSMIEEIRGNSSQNQNDQYIAYNQMREKQGSSIKEKDMMFQMTETMEPLNLLNDHNNNGKLKRRLEGETIPHNPQTSRSANSLRSFRPDKLDSKRSLLSKRSNLEEVPDNVQQQSQNANSQKKSSLISRKKKKQNEITHHNYVSKIIGYTQEGIFIMENSLISVMKNPDISQKRMIKKTSISESQRSFQDTLQAYGFQLNEYGACKFTTTLEIPHMKNEEQYPVHALKTKQTKETIQFSEYYSIKQKLQSDPA